MKNKRRFKVCYYGCVITVLIVLPKIPLPVHDLAFHPMLLATWFFLIRGVIALWQDLYKFWRWYNGN